MKKILSLILIIFISSIFFQNCRRKDECPPVVPFVKNYEIPDGDIANIPYKGYDTLTYISDAGDTAMLYGHGRKKSVYWAVKETVNAEHCKVDNSYYYYKVETELTGSDTALSRIKYEIYVRKEFPTEIQMSYYINLIPDGYTPDFINNQSKYKDSIQINGKFYTGRRLNIENTLNYLYNNKYGFLQIKFESGKTWTMKF